ncbi:MAG: hypothetical protein NVV57_05425 [Demequina sp.]|jgi:hypothetical protein|nr:hypothetical protein [Demequina sp.]
MGTYVEWDALFNIVIFGLLIGAGLPALYALGVRSLDVSSRAVGRSATLLKVAAYTCFAVVVGAILFALIFIAAGGH